MYCCPKEIFSLGDQTKAKKKKKKVLLPREAEVVHTTW